MRIFEKPFFTLLAAIVISAVTSGCAVYVPAPRAYVAAPVPVVVAPVWGFGFYGGRHW